jgi:hypothetical protein
MRGLWSVARGRKSGPREYCSVTIYRPGAWAISRRAMAGIRARRRVTDRSAATFFDFIRHLFLPYQAIVKCCREPGNTTLPAAPTQPGMPSSPAGTIQGCDLPDKRMRPIRVRDFRRRRCDEIHVRQGRDSPGVFGGNARSALRKPRSQSTGQEATTLRRRDGAPYLRSTSKRQRIWCRHR